MTLITCSTDSPNALLSPLDCDQLPLTLFVNLILIPRRGAMLNSFETSIIRSSSLGLSRTRMVLKPIFCDKRARLINSLSLIPLQIIVELLERSWAKAINNSGLEPTSSPKSNSFPYSTILSITWACWLTLTGKTPL